MTDFNSGAFTANLDPAKNHRHRPSTALGWCRKDSPASRCGDILAELARRVTARTDAPTLRATGLGHVIGGGDDPISAEALYPRWEKFLHARRHPVAETGTASMGLAFAGCRRGDVPQSVSLGRDRLGHPRRVRRRGRAPDGRVVLVTGEGSHQLTAQEISQFGRRGLSPISSCSTTTAI